jgi:hypothetical protein
VLLLLLPAPARSAPIYNAVAEFSVTNGNPNGVWSYGKSASATGSFSAHTVASDSDPLEYWFNSADPFPAFYPLVAKNVSGADVDLGSGQIVPNDVLLLSPGCEPPTTYFPCGAGDSWSVLRFVAPADGNFEFAGSFLGLTGASTDVAVTLDDAVLDVLSGNTQIDGTELLPFGFSLGLQAGDAVDFRVGPRGDIIADSILLELAVTVVPEPSTFALTALAMTGLAAARRRRSSGDC